MQAATQLERIGVLILPSLRHRIELVMNTGASWSACRGSPTAIPASASSFRRLPFGLVLRIVAATVADEIADVAEILADDEELRIAVAEPLLPMTDDLGIELEFGATPDPPGAALDANPAGLPRRDQRIVIVRHAGPLLSVVIPAQAGIHLSTATLPDRWIPAVAGMTKGPEMKIRDIKTYVLEAALTEPFAYSQAWYERRGACLRRASPRRSSSSTSRC